MKSASVRRIRYFGVLFILVCKRICRRLAAAAQDPPQDEDRRQQVFYHRVPPHHALVARPVPNKSTEHVLRFIELVLSFDTPQAVITDNDRVLTSRSASRYFADRHIQSIPNSTLRSRS